MSVFVCECVRERQRESDRESEREKENHGKLSPIQRIENTCDRSTITAICQLKTKCLTTALKWVK